LRVFSAVSSVAFAVLDCIVDKDSIRPACALNEPAEEVFMFDAESELTFIPSLNFSAACFVFSGIAFTCSAIASYSAFAFSNYSFNSLPPLANSLRISTAFCL
jgi:hypothetical protein